MKREIDREFMCLVQAVDYIVGDVPNLTGYKGQIIAKDDSIKVYMFCYKFGYVVSISDPNLTLISSMVIPNYSDLPEISRTPDVIVAEMM